MLCVKGLSAHTAPYRVCRGCVRVRLASHAAACMHGVGRVLFPGEVVFPDDIPQGTSASRASRSTDLRISVCVVRCGGMRWFAHPVIWGGASPHRALSRHAMSHCALSCSMRRAAQRWVSVCAGYGLLTLSSRGALAHDLATVIAPTSAPAQGQCTQHRSGLRHRSSCGALAHTLATAIALTGAPTRGQSPPPSASCTPAASALADIGHQRHTFALGRNWHSLTFSLRLRP